MGQKQTVRNLSLIAVGALLLAAGSARGAMGNFNDYDGDGASDLAVYIPESNQWFIRSLGPGPAIAFGTEWGLDGCLCLPGDYNGNGTHDLAFYQFDTMSWFAREAGNAPAILLGTVWGLDSGVPVPGDYNGDGANDLAIYEMSTGNWVIRNVADGLPPIVFGLQWGNSEMVPVPGDYNGDGADDLAVYHPETGTWYIRSLANGPAIAFGMQWGFDGCVPVAGDFNGDGRHDLAVYHEESGYWFIRSITPGPAIFFGKHWGGQGYVPVPGDYNGDGRWDVAVYREADGQWFIRNVQDGVPPIVFGLVWGTPDTVPVGQAGVYGSLSWDDELVLPAAGNLDQSVPVYLPYDEDWVLEAELLGCYGGVWNRYLKGDWIDHLDLFPGRLGRMSLRLAHGHVWFLSANVGDGHFWPYWTSDHYGFTIPELEIYSGDHSLRIEYRQSADNCRFWWDGELVGDWNIWIESVQTPMTFLRVGHIQGGMLRYYVGSFQSMAK